MLTQETKLTTGDGRVLSVKEIANIYRNGVNFATPSSGKIQKLDANNYSLTCRFSTTDCDTLESIKTSKAYALTTTLRNNTERCIESVRCISEHQAVSEHVVTSNNGRYLARIRSPAKNQPTNGDSSADVRQLLEIWDRSRLLRTLDIAESDTHGPISLDAQFGSMSWYPFGDQDKLMYVCQKKRPRIQSFFKQQSSSTKRDQENALDSAGGPEEGKPSAASLGDKYAREEDWGECLVGTQHTIVAVLDVANDFKVTTLDMEGHSLASTKWLNDLKTVSVAYPEEPRRLGLIYTNSRQSHLIVHDWSQISSSATGERPVEVFSMKSNSHSYHTPRVDHSGRRFVYFKNAAWGPHFHSVRLHIHDMNTNQDLELTDKTTGERDLFALGLLQTCFSEDDQHILLVKSDYLHDHLCLYSLAESKFTKIKFPTTGLSLLDFKHDVILATGSEVNATPTLYVAVLTQKDPGELVAWHQIEESIHLEEIDYETYKIPTPDGLSFVSALLATPSVDIIQRNFSGESISTRCAASQSELPTIVIVHGGPHSQFKVYYMPNLVLYARLGLRTLLINYRGSTGVSQEYVESLVGKVGQQDVSDCLHAIRHLAKSRLINPKKLILQGGSHGGFLGCHLSCQEEFKFTCAIIRNPVVDISTMHTTTDIPDWCYSVALSREGYDPSWVPSSAELAKMFECSPMAKHTQANVPTLMMLGTKDRRVPSFQGARWIELLKARGLETQCKVYADNHGLERPETQADAAMTGIVWMLQHL